MPTPGKQLSPAELAALEHAFAADPSSDAYRPLAEAYLAMGRFMEAMVVCKKGVKAHPAEAGARVLLARVYADQGKDRKALEELQGALGVSPNDAPANLMAGLIYMKLGEADQGAAALRKAAEADPADAGTQEALKKWGIAVAAPPPPAAARNGQAAAHDNSAEPTELEIPAPAQPARNVAADIPVLTPAAKPAASAQHARPAAQPPRSGNTNVAPRPQAPAQQQARPAARPAPQPRPRERAAPPDPDYADELRERYTTGEFPLEKHGSAANAFKGTIITAIVLALALAGFTGYSQYRKKRDIEIDKLLRDTRSLLDKDSFGGYTQAAKLCEKVLDRDPDSIAGHAYLAYVDAIRWGEHGEDTKDEAQKQLKAAEKLTDEHSHMFAAKAYLTYYGGDAKGAIDFLRKILTGPSGGTSGLLYGALGIIQMQSGDLDGAKDSLTQAQRFSPTDVRVYQMLAEQYRRRGSGFELQASILYDNALRLAPDHVPSMLGKAKMLIDAQQYDDALKIVQKVLDLGRENASPRQLAVAHALKGNVLYAKGKKAEGANEEEQARLGDPNNADIADLIGRRKARDGDVAGAVDLFNAAIRAEPQRVMFYVDLANALLQKKDGAKQAVEALKNAANRMPSNGRIAKLLGDAYRAEGDFDRSHAQYENAIVLEKRYPEAHRALAMLYKDKKDWGHALDELDKAVKDFSAGAAGGEGVSDAYEQMAIIEMDRGGKQDAVNDLWTKALKADPTNCNALWNLGKQAHEHRIKDAAKQMLGDYAKICKQWPHAAEAAAIVAKLR